MRVFLDFEASSLSDDSYPIEVGWVFEDGRGENHLIRPAAAWTEWDPASEAIHGIVRATLDTEGEDHAWVAHRLLDQLSGHDLFASAPSWDGKWLSVLLRAADLPRHALRLRDTDEALCATALDLLQPVLPAAALDRAVHDLVARHGSKAGAPPAHRALADAMGEYELWRRVRDAALAMAGGAG